MDYKVGKIVRIFQMEPSFLYSFYILLSLQQLFVERMLCRCCNFFSHLHLLDLRLYLLVQWAKRKILAGFVFCWREIQ